MEFPFYNLKLLIKIQNHIEKWHWIVHNLQSKNFVPCSQIFFDIFDWLKKDAVQNDVGLFGGIIQIGRRKT